MHTPGNWEIRKAVIKSADIAIVVPSILDENDGEPVIIAECFSDFRSNKEYAALECMDNARLISAAPDLLRCLIDAQEELRLIRMKDCDRVYDSTLRIRMQHAIAKSGASA